MPNQQTESKEQKQSINKNEKKSGFSFLSSGWTAVLIYTAAAFLCLAPASFYGSKAVFGYLGYENTAQTLWIYYSWSQYYQSMLDYCSSHYGLSGIFSNIGEIYNYITGFGERSSVSNGIDFLWTWPLEKIFGTPYYYNIKCIIILAANAYAVRILCRFMKCSPAASLLGGLLFTFNPWVFYLMATGRIIESQAFVPVLFIYSFMAAWESFDYKKWTFSGLMLALTADTYWFYGHFAVVFALFFLCWKAAVSIFSHLKEKKSFDFSFRNFNIKDTAVCTMMFLLTFAVFVLPSAHPYLVRVCCGTQLPGLVRPDPGQDYDPAIFYRQSINFSCEADYPVKQLDTSSHSPLSPPCSIPLQATFSANVTMMVLAAGVSLFLYKKYTQRAYHIMWFAAFLCFYWLPLGPFLKLNGRLIQVFGHPIPLPYKLMSDYMPLFDKLFWPIQSMFLFALAAAAFLALTYDAMQKHAKMSKTMLAGIAVLAAVLPIAEQLQRNQLPMAYSQAPQKRAEALNAENPVLEASCIFVPVGRRVWESALDFNRNFYHDSDLTLADFRLAADKCKGLFSRHQYNTGRDAWLFEYQVLADHPFMRFICDLGGPNIPGTFSREDLKQVQNEGYRYIAVSERFCSHITDGGSYMTDSKAGKIIYDDICVRMDSLFGKPVLDTTELTFDRNSDNDKIEEYQYRLRFYDTYSFEKHKSESK